MPTALPTDWQLNHDECLRVRDAGDEHGRRRWRKFDSHQFLGKVGIDTRDTVLVGKQMQKGPTVHVHSAVVLMASISCHRRKASFRMYGKTIPKRPVFLSTQG